MNQTKITQQNYHIEDKQQYNQQNYHQYQKPMTENNNFIKTHRKTQSNSIHAPFVGYKPTHTREYSNGFVNTTIQTIKQNIPKKSNQPSSNIHRQKNMSAHTDWKRKQQQHFYSSNKQQQQFYCSLQTETIQNLRGYNLEIRRRLNYQLKKNNQLIKACQALAEENQHEREKNRKMKAKRLLIEENKKLKQKLQNFDMFPIGIINKMKQLQQENNQLKSQLQTVKNREYHEKCKNYDDFL